jgi:hypothetical protein
MAVVLGEGTRDGWFGSGGLGQLCGCCAEMSCSGKTKVQGSVELQNECSVWNKIHSCTLPFPRLLERVVTTFRDCLVMFRCMCIPKAGSAQIDLSFVMCSCELTRA